MRLITALNKRHDNKPVWIAGSDPTLVDYPDSFFDDKIGITLHLAHLKFPGATYRYANEYDRVEFLLGKDPSFAEQESVFAWPFYGRTKEESRLLIEGMPNVYHLRWIRYPPRGIREYVGWNYTLRKVRAARHGRSAIYGGHGTCLHGALYLAVMLGGNPINMIGCGHGRVSAEGEHFSFAGGVDRDMRPGIRSFSDPIRNVPMIEQTLALIEACRKEGIQVNWIKRFANGGSLEPMSVDIEEILTLKRSIKWPRSPSRRAKNAVKTVTLPVINLFR